MEVAAKTFSTKGWGACGVAPQLDVGFALDNAELLLDTIPGPSANVNGGTPTLEAQLQAMAAAGGTQDYLEADDAPALAAALTEVVEASYANSCLLDLGEAPSAPEFTVVEVGGQAWPEVQACADEDGWTWTNNELTRMQLCNAACDALLDTKEVTVEYHCDAG